MDSIHGGRGHALRIRGGIDSDLAASVHVERDASEVAVVVAPADDRDAISAHVLQATDDGVKGLVRRLRRVVVAGDGNETRIGHAAGSGGAVGGNRGGIGDVREQFVAATRNDEIDAGIQ